MNLYFVCSVPMGMDVNEATHGNALLVAIDVCIVIFVTIYDICHCFVSSSLL